MKILGIETSCDETACAIVEDGRRILSNTIASQIDLHTKTGGVVPEVAAREHVLKIVPVLDECLQRAGCDFDDIFAIAVAKGPGLISSLIIGTETANVISYVKNMPLIPVQHIVGHIYSNWLYGKAEGGTAGSERAGEAAGDDEIEFPVLILTVSGGHNELILMRGHFEFEVLGETRDDAAGEAFDKVARILGLGYPGGPIISKISENGDNQAFDLPRSYLEKGSLDFSFSGLKTAVLREVKKREEEKGRLRFAASLFTASLAASFQEAVTEVLSKKLKMAADKYPEIKEVHLAGGVSANLRLRAKVEEEFSGKIKLRFPKEIIYCTDNAAMIAAAGYYLYKKSPDKFTPNTNITPSTSFEI